MRPAERERHAVLGARHRRAVAPDIGGSPQDLSAKRCRDPGIEPAGEVGANQPAEDVAAPADWTFDDYNRGEKDIRAYLRQQGARQTSIAYAENRGLVFRGSIFHQTAPLRFAEGFENRRRNVTMLFRRTRS